MRAIVSRGLALLGLLLLAPALAGAQTYLQREDPAGLMRGTHFDLDPAASMVSSVDSSLMADVLIHPTPKSFVMAIGAAEAPPGGTLAHLTLSGLLPSTAYYRYTDDFEHLDVVLTDAEGRHEFDLELADPRLVIVQPNPSTIHLKADGTGCPFIGTWDAATVTCTLRRDVAQTIEVDDDGVTLDGNGFRIDGTSVFVGSSGVLVGRRTGVTVRNIVVDGAPAGVIASGTSDSLFENITVRNGNGGFLSVFQTPAAGAGRNTWRNNSVSVVCAPGDTPPCGYGFSGLYNNEEVITGNVVSGAKYGITTSLTVTPLIADNVLENCETGIQVLASLTAATVNGNTVNGAGNGLVINTAVGCEVMGNVVDAASGEALRMSSRECMVAGNTLSNSTLGLNVLGSLNTIVHNQFIDNVRQAEVAAGATENLLSQPPRIGGNHWSDFDQEGEGCVDANADGYCDAPYAATGGLDLSPWAADLGWLDVMPPSTSVALDGIAGSAGWYRSPVTATFTAEDEPGGTGVLRSEYGFDDAVFSPADGGVTLAAEGTTRLFYRSVDRAGNAGAPQSVEIPIDTGAPSVDSALDPPANGQGWNNSDVQVAFTCYDAVSGVAFCPAPVTVSAEGADQAVTGEAADIAGNAGSGMATVNLDRTAPGIAFTGGCDTSHLLNSAVTTDVAVTDALSGIDAQSVANGPAPLPTAKVGPQALPVAARDRAGNTTAASCAYAVTYDFFGAGGFQAPIDDSPVVNVARAGSAVPVKWQLPDGKGGFLSSLAVVRSVQTQQVSCASFDSSLSDPVETSAAGASGLHFDFGDMQYVYNWKTERMMGGRCFVLLLNLDDGRSYRADFRFTR